MSTEAVVGGDENSVVQVLLKTLLDAIRKLAGGSRLQVFDSHRAKWLPQDKACLAKNFLSPDAFVMLEAFAGEGLGPALGTRLFHTIRALVEGKHGDAHGNKAMGQAKDYAEKLKPYMSVVHVRRPEISPTLLFPVLLFGSFT